MKNIYSFVIAVAITLLAGGIFKVNAQLFQNAATSAGIHHTAVSQTAIGGGGAFFDYDNDGFLDIFLIGGDGKDLLYKNNGDGTYTDVSVAAGIVKDPTLWTMGVVTGDIENDGDRDILVTTSSIMLNGNLRPYHSLLYKNNGDGTFTESAAVSGIVDSSWSVSASMGDYNEDGFLDIYIVNYVEQSKFFRDSANNVIGFNHDCYPNFFYINQGNGTFVESAAAMGLDDPGCGLATTWTDYDNDNDVDLIVVNDFGEWVVPIRLFRNNYPSNSFTDVSDTLGFNAGIYGMGVAIGDYDEDQDLDYYFTNIGSNVFYEQRDTGFVDVTAMTGTLNTHVDSPLYATSWGAGFLDYNNDTWLDLYVNNGYIPAAQFIATDPDDPNLLYRNNGDGSFTNVAPTSGLADYSVGRGYAHADYDNDGDLDILSVLVDNDTFNFTFTKLYQNKQATGNNWLKVRLEGTLSNRDAFGARIKLVAGGRAFIREIDGGSSHVSQHASDAHFGLGSIPMVDSLIITWPSGAVEIYTNINSNQYLYYIEGTNQYVLVYNKLQDCGIISMELVYDTITAVGAYDTLFYLLKQPQPTYTITAYDTICQGDSIFLGGAYRFFPGTYIDTLYGQAACDTVLYTTLTVLNPVVFTTEIICQGDSILIFGQYRDSAGVYLHKAPSATGCDTTFAVNLKVNPSYVNVMHIPICNQDSVFLLGSYWDTTVTLYDTLSTVQGCDSVIVYEVLSGEKVIINKNNVSICSGDSIFVGGAYQYQAGTYFDTISNPSGCDTVIITPVTVTTPYVTPTKVVICEGDSALLGGAYQTIGGLYNDTLQAVDGCDSIIITNLVVIVPALDSVEYTICAGESFFAGGGFQTQPGYYTDVLTGQYGCDSTVVTHLLVAQPKFDTVDMEVCFGDSTFVNGNFYSADATVLDTLTSAVGCDSFLTIMVDVLDEKTGTAQASICDGDSIYLGGAWQTAAGTYTDTLMPGIGCDSIVVTELSITADVFTDTLIVIDEGDSIFAGGNWQTTSGIYYDTYVGPNGCDSVVATQLDVQVGIKEFVTTGRIQVYPNPSAGVFTLDLERLDAEVMLEVFNAQGRLLQSERVRTTSHTIHMEQFPEGIYLLKLTIEGDIYHHKLVIAK